MSRESLHLYRAHLLERLEHGRDGDFAPVVKLLMSPELVPDPRFYDRVDADGIDWDAVLADTTWSPTQRFLLEVAHGLFSGRGPMGPLRLLDDWQLALFTGMLAASTSGKVELKNPLRDQLMTPLAPGEAQ